MKSRLLIFVLALAALTAPAVAQLAKGKGAEQRLNEAELKKALLGIDMQGFSPSENISWRECIQPNGETLYEVPDQVLKGRLDISPDGRACFSYNDNDYATAGCFWAYRQGKDGLRFEADYKLTTGEPAAIFVTTKVVTGVTSCKPKSLIS
jgi:hypothetical protein